MSKVIKRLARAILSRTPYALMRREGLDYAARQQRRLVTQIHGLLRELSFPDLPNTPGRVKLLTELIGTDPIEGMFILDALHRALKVPGGICEFGVAQGATSAMLANELVLHAPSRILWLYDSFEGLPAPTDRDVLTDDILELGSMGAYTGRFAESRMEVAHRLAAVGWRPGQTRIVAGYFTSKTTRLPDQVAFAYLDFDLYEPTRDVLAAVHDHSQAGALVVVDDYGFFSAGVKTAVDEFAAERDEWKVHHPPRDCAFVTLERVR